MGEIVDNVQGDRINVLRRRSLSEIKIDFVTLLVLARDQKSKP
jgi:hypothetical protein